MKHMSSNGISLLKSFEGCHLKAYWDVDGYSIGYGHHENVKKGDTITEQEAIEMLKDDLARIYEPIVFKYDSKYNFNQNEFDALVDFCYNCGAGNLKLLTASGRRTKEEIAEKMLLYNKAGGTVLAGLTKRRRAEHDLFLLKKNCYYPKYSGSAYMIDTVLKSIGATNDYDSRYSNYKKRTPVAEANGITRYTGSATQNIELIAKAKAGLLKRV